MSSIKTEQPTIYRLFSKLIKKERLQHAYLFEGNIGTGKKRTALWIAKTLYCVNLGKDLTPCDECYQCKRIDSHQHPDVVEVEPDGLSIKVDQVRQLKGEFSTSGMEGKQKVIIIDDVEKMTVNAANSLLKFLEEPAGALTAFLLTAQKQSILPTIISRCQVVSFPDQSIKGRINYLKQYGISEGQASILCRLTQSNEEAVHLNNETNLNEIIDASWRWFKLQMDKNSQSFVFVHTDLMPLLNNRDEYHRLLDLILYFYRDLLTLYFIKDAGIAFEKYRQTLEEYTKWLTADQISNVIEYILESKKKLTSNVAAQGIFEDLSLRINEL